MTTAHHLPKNREGLTYGEWYAAATWSVERRTGKRPLHYSNKRLRKAWREGEDPTEWCAHFQNGGK